MADAAKAAYRAKYTTALGAMEHVRSGMKLGLGTGSTAAIFVDLLGQAVAQGLDVVGVPTSSRTAAQAQALGIALTTLEHATRLDLTIDGADEFDPDLNLIKGGGGALLQEKIVASASDRMVVIADAAKRVEHLGRFALPVEVVRFGWHSTRAQIAGLLAGADVDGREISLRMAGGAPFVTDEGHHILDLHLGRIGDPAGLARALNLLPGVVESGLFIGLATTVLVGEADGTLAVIERGTGELPPRRLILPDNI